MFLLNYSFSCCCNSSSGLPCCNFDNSCCAPSTAVIAIALVIIGALALTQSWSGFAPAGCYACLAIGGLDLLVLCAKAIHHLRVSCRAVEMARIRQNPTGFTFEALLRNALDETNEVWPYAIKKLLQEAVFVPANTTGPDELLACHDRIIVGNCSLEDDQIDALSSEGHLCKPVSVYHACQDYPHHHILPFDHPQLSNFDAMVTQLKNRYESSIAFGGFYPFIATIMTETLEERGLTREAITDDPELIARHVAYKLLSRATIKEDCLEFRQNGRILNLRFSEDPSAIPNELMDQEAGLITQALRAAKILKNLTTQERALFKQALEQQEGATITSLLPNHPRLEATFSTVATHIMNRFFPSYGGQARLSSAEFNRQIETYFSIENPQGFGSNCFYVACLRQLPFLEKLSWGATQFCQVSNLRKAVADYLRSNQSDFIGEEPTDPSARTDYAEHRERVETAIEEALTGDYSSELTYLAMAAILNRPLYLFDNYNSHQSDSQNRPLPDYSYNVTSPHRPLYIFGNAHFRPLIPKRPITWIHAIPSH